MIDHTFNQIQALIDYSKAVDMCVLVMDDDEGPFILTNIVKHAHKILLNYCVLDDLVESVLDSDRDEMMVKTIVDGSFWVETFDNGIRCKLIAGNNIEIYIGMPDDIIMPMDYIFLADENETSSEYEDENISGDIDDHDHDLKFIKYMENHDVTE